MTSYTVLVAGDCYISTLLGDGAATDEIWRRFGGAGDVFANLEVAFTNQPAYGDKSCLKASPEIAISIREAGFTVMTLANNHTMDYGHKGLSDTIAALDRIGVASVGAGNTVVDAMRPHVRHIDGKAIGFMGFSCLVPPGSRATMHRPGIAGIRIVTKYVIDPALLAEQPGTAPYIETVPVPEDLTSARETVAQVKETVDVLLVGVHWGLELGSVAPFLQGDLAMYQRPVAHALIEAGADAVIGHHSHILNGIEFHRSKPILYGLGNLIFHAEQIDGGFPSYPPYTFEYYEPGLDRVGAIGRLTWKEEIGGPPHVELWPIWRNEAGEPTLGGDELVQRALKRLEKQSVAFNAVFALESGVVRATERNAEFGRPDSLK